MTDDAIRMAVHANHGKRIAIVVPWFPNISETFVVQRVMRLLARGWDVHVVCTGGITDDWAAFPYLESRADMRRRVHAIPSLETYRQILARFPMALVAAAIRNPRGTSRYLSRGWKRYGRGVIRRFVEDAALVRIRAAVVHFEFGHLLKGRQHLADLLDCALVASFQGYDLNYVGLEHEPGYYTDVWRGADAVHFVSRDLERRAYERGFTDTASGFVVLNGVDVSAFDRAQSQSSGVVGTAERPFRILSVGRLHWKKGYDYALQSVRMLIDFGVACEYRIVGDGAFREAVLYTVRDLNLQEVVTFVGALPHHEVPREMAWADVFLHAAVSEGFCLAVAEAQAMQLPVVTSDADGLRENVVDGETGFVVSRRDVAAMMEKLKELSADPDLRTRFGRAGRDHVRMRFTIDAHVDGMEAVYRAALERTTRRQGSAPSGAG